MPWGDWQFWIVTIIVLLAGWWILKPIIPRRKTPGSTTKVKLTVGGRKPE